MSLSRRSFLRGAAAAALAPLPLFVRPAWAGRAAGPGGAPLLVVVFLRGGADGLALLAPLGDPDLERHRPDFVPGDATLLPGPSFEFGLHPSLAALVPLARQGALAGAHAVGLPSPVRSHFEAQDLCERAGAAAGAATPGWLARALAEGDPGTLSLLGFADQRPLALDGAQAALNLPRGEAPRNPARSAAARRALEQLFAGAEPGAPLPLRRPGREGLEALEALAAHRQDPLPPAARFPQGELGERLAGLARLARADLGLAAAWVDAEGWDTHVRQGNEEGALAQRGRELAEGLAALCLALESRLDRTLVLVVSEFGRTIEPNGSGGTDHGRGGMALVLGGAVAGARVRTRWPGLAPEARDRRDLAVTTDVRDLFADGARHLGVAPLDRVFPGHRAGSTGLLRRPS